MPFRVKPARFAWRALPRAGSRRRLQPGPDYGSWADSFPRRCTRALLEQCIEARSRPESKRWWPKCAIYLYFTCARSLFLATKSSPKVTASLSGCQAVPGLGFGYRFVTVVPGRDG